MGEVTAVLIGARPSDREWVDVEPGSMRALDDWGSRVQFKDSSGEVWTVPGRDGTIAGWRREAL
jgi:hypothetical protein